MTIATDDTHPRPGAIAARRLAFFLLAVVATPTQASDALARCLHDPATPAGRAALCSEALASGMETRDQVAALLRRAGAHFEGGLSDAALADLGQATELAPDNARAWRARGMIRNARSEYALAVVDLDRALALAPGDIDARRHRAHAHARLGRPSLAVADLDVVLAGTADDANDYYDRGLSHTALEQWGLAAADFNHAMALSPDYAGEFPPGCLSRDPDTGKARLVNWPACER